MALPAPPELPLELGLKETAGLRVGDEQAVGVGAFPVAVEGGDALVEPLMLPPLLKLVVGDEQALANAEAV